MKILRLTTLACLVLAGYTLDASARASSGVPLPTAATVGGAFDTFSALLEGRWSDAWLTILQTFERASQVD